MKLSSLSCTLFLLALSASASSSVLARPDYKGNPCTYNWNGVQPGNGDDFHCDADGWADYNNNWHKFVPLALTILCTLTVFFGIPIAMICRYFLGCCGSSAITPDQGCCTSCSSSAVKQENEQLSESERLNKYSSFSVRFVKGLTVFVGVLAIGSTAVIIHGTSRAAYGVNNYIGGARSFSTWAQSHLQTIKNGINETNPVFADSVHKINEINNHLSDWKNSVESCVDENGDCHGGVPPAVLGLFGFSFPSITVVLSSIAACVCACMGVRKIGPFVLLILTCITVAFVGCLAIGLGGLDVAQNIYCGEVHAWENNQTGIISWYVLPDVCEKRISFKNELQNDIKTFSFDTCKQIAENCDDLPTYTPTTSNRQNLFYCPTTPSCSTPSEVNETLKNVKVKIGVPGNLQSSCNTNKCSIVQCAEQCTNSAMKSLSKTFVSNSVQVSNAHNVLINVLEAELNCPAVIRRFVRTFYICGEVRKGTHLMFKGNALSVFACFVLMIVLFLGQKRFVNKEKEALRLRQEQQRQQFDQTANAALIQEQDYPLYGSVVAANENGERYIKEQPLEF